MDQLETGNRPSGIPRASRLPVLSKRSSQLFVDPPQDLQSNIPTTSRLAKRSSIAVLPQRTTAVPSRTPLSNGKPRVSTRSSSIRSISSLVSIQGDDEKRASSRQSSYDDFDNATPSTTKVRKSRQSLSDRAIESIQAIPTTPKDRRQSNFFNTAESPMAPPLPRPGSVMSNKSRPGTSDGTFTKPAPPTALKIPTSAKPLSRTSNSFGYAKRSTSFTTKLQSARDKPRPASPEIVDDGEEAPLTAIKHKPERSISGSMKPPSNASSNALRQQIAAARAAARKERDQPLHDSPQELVRVLQDVADPFNTTPRDGKHILRNRIKAARIDGKLNIAALELTGIPEEVITMYNYALASEEDKANWAEVLDLTRFIAADNNLDSIADNVFPDTTSTDEHVQQGQFGGLEMLDLHGNTLNSLPLGLRQLQCLTILNVMHNKLDNNSLETIAQIRTLKELRLGHNNISGNLPTSLCTLTSLEVLDLQANRLLALSEAIRELSALRVLNVSSNQLTSIPMDALSQLPLYDLDVSSNALIASLFPLGGSNYHHTLKTLSLANNSLAALTFTTELEMPELQTLDITNNHLTILPSVQGWQKLVTLYASDNKISDLPAGFTDLKQLRIANFSGNELHILPPELSLMESLTTLILASNPLRHKKYLTMNALDIKQDLRALLKQNGTDDYDDETASWGTAPEDSAISNGWSLKHGGLLDLSSRGLTDAINDSLGSFLKTNEVRQLNLQGNKLTTIPPALWLAQDLRSLDLSNNPLDEEYLTEDLELPSLLNLAMATCRITRLTPVIYHLRAPRLQSIQISGNRLSGCVPDLHQSYPLLLTLLASDNKFETVDADALRGYSTVDLSSNQLESLPAEIGMLWEEGLKSFEVGRNVFRVPGYRVLEKGTFQTLQWLRARIQNRDGNQEDVVY